MSTEPVISEIKAATPTIAPTIRIVRQPHRDEGRPVSPVELPRRAHQLAERALLAQAGEVDRGPARQPDRHRDQQDQDDADQDGAEAGPGLEVDEAGGTVTTPDRRPGDGGSEDQPARGASGSRSERRPSR